MIHSSPFWVCISKGNKIRILMRYLHSHVHCSIIHNRQDMETTLVSVNRWMDKEDEVRACLCWVASVMADSLWPYGPYPAKLPCPWDSLGKNTGVGCCPPPGDLPNPGIKSMCLTSLALAGRFFTTNSVYIYSVEYYSAVRKKEILPFATTWADLQKSWIHWNRE